MRLPGFLADRSRSSDAGNLHWEATDDGLLFKSGKPVATIVHELASREVPALLEQLADEGLAEPRPDGTLLTWGHVYQLQRSRIYASSISHLQLPPTVEVAPRLNSTGSLTDASFAIALSGWLDRTGRDVATDGTCGAMVVAAGEIRLLPESVFHLMTAVHAMQDGNRTSSSPSATSSPARQSRMRAWSRSPVRLRDELLNETVFRSLVHARELLAKWRDDYDGCRLHTSLTGLTPNEFATRSYYSV